MARGSKSAKAAQEPAANSGLKTFQYTAVSQTGERVKAKMQAPDPDAVSLALAQEGWVPLKVTEIAAGGLNFDVAKLVGRDGFRMKPSELAAFTRQLHQLLRAGVAVPRTLAALGEEADPRLTQICLEISDKVSAGVPLSDAFGEHPDLFDEVFCAYIAAGEEAGTLVQSTGRLAKLLEKESQLRNKVKSATAYPKMVSIAIGAIVMGILLFMVPGFQGIYSQFNAELPAPTRGLLWISGTVNPLHPQIGSVEYAQVPLKGDDSDEPALIEVIDGEIDVSWTDIDGAWNPQDAPTNLFTADGDMVPRELVEEDSLMVHRTWLVARSVVKAPTAGADGKRSGLGVIQICEDGSVGTPPPPGYEGEPWVAVECEKNENLTTELGLFARYGEVFSEPSISWLNPTTWLEPLRQPGRSLWTSPFNVTSPVIYLLLALFFTRRFLRKHEDDLDIGERVDRIRFSLPIMGDLTKRIAMFRWSSTLAGALEAGVQTHRALEIAANASGSKWIKKATLTVQEGVQSGKPVSTGLSEYKDLFPPSIRALVLTGEQTGELDTMLDSAAETLDEEINAIISGLAAKIEVVLIITMGVVVGSIVVVLYLPIFSLATVASAGVEGGSYTPPVDAPWPEPRTPR